MLNDDVGITVLFCMQGSLHAGKSQDGAAALLLGRRPHHLAHVREALEVVRLRRRRRRRNDLRGREVRGELWRRRGMDGLLLGRGRHRGPPPAVPRRQRGGLLAALV